MDKQDQNHIQIQPELQASSNLKQHLLKQQQKNKSFHQSKDQSIKLNQENIAIKQNYQLKNNVLKAKNFFSNLFFSWISPFAAYGNHFQITKQNAPILPADQKPKIQFDKLYNTLKAQQKNQKQGRVLAKVIAKSYKRQFIIVLVLAFIYIALSMYAPVITDQIINYIQQGSINRQISKGIVLFVGIFSLAFFKLITQTHLFYIFGIIGFNLSNTITLLLYQKSLKHPVLCLKKYSVSEIINYSQVDAQRMTYMGFQLTSLIFTPIQVFIGLWLMYNFIGISFLSGIGVMVVTITFTFIFSKISINANQHVLKAKDERMKISQQIFNIIRFIKVNAFQKYFWQKLNFKRQKQLNLNKRKLMYEIFTIFIYWLASPLILSMTFATYTWLGNQMSATQAFTTIMLFRILQYPIRLLPTAISQSIQIWTSIKRIQKFLLSEQIEYDNIKVGNAKDMFAVRISNGTFAWGKQKPKQDDKKKNEKDEDKKKQKQKQPSSILTDSISQNLNNQMANQSVLTQSLLSVQERKVNQKLKQDQPQYVKALRDINLQIYSGTFTIVVGDIGSGKSSFLYSILNQMKPSKDAMVQINGSIAYVPQKPWIMSGSVKDNITFTLPYDKNKFDQVIKYSSMNTDLSLLVNGQMTQIGQKGTNLSGGQKARIGLARALYSDRDIFLLDDIISAVDVHVGEFIMKQTILKYLRKKTVIMPTHAVKFAQYADKIIIMKKGKIIKAGKYQEIKDSSQFKQICLQKESKKKSQSKPQNDQKLIEDLKKIKLAQQQKLERDKQSKNIFKEKQKDITQKIVEQLVMPEDQQKGQIGLDIYKQYISLNGGIKFIIFVVFCMSCWLGFTTMSNIWMQKWCEAPQQGNQYLYIFLALSITSSVFMLLRAYTLVIGGIKCGTTIHKKITKALLYASLNKFYNRVPLGRIINRLTKDLRQIDQAIGYSVGDFFVCSFGLLGTLIICLYGSTWLILIPMIFVGYISNRFRIYYMKTQRQCVRLQNITSSPIVSGFLSAINGIETIRAYNLQDKFLDMQIEKIDQNKRLRITRQALQSWFCQRLSSITFIINMSAIGYCMFSKNQNSSLAGLLLTYALTLGDDIIDTIFSFTYLETKMVSVQRVSNFTKIQPQEGYQQYTKNWRTKQEGYQQVVTRGQITFVDSKVRYRPQLPLVLKGVNIHIQKGEKVGIVGRTGAGKSTIINCLLRVLECSSGQILIDGKNINEYFLKDLRSNITMIDQEPVLINGTFRENLDPRKTYTSQQLTDIIKECNLHEVVEEKGGLDSKITNESLSVGEKQLLCICRAFLKHSKIVLVDEATANIDQKNDQLIQEVISTKFKQSTVLTIAHRLSTLKNSDKILVMGEGKVLEWGSPEELMQKDGGIYREMCQKGNMTEQYLI